MTLPGLLLAVHVAAGTAGLLLAGPVLFVRKRRGAHTWLGRAYAIAAALLCLTAFVLVAYDPAALAGLAVLGVLTVGWVGAGVWLARRRPRLGAPGRWRVWHLNCMGSSVIAFVTAFVVQVANGHPLAWVAPTLIGAPLISWRTRREVAALTRRNRRVDQGAGAAGAGVSRPGSLDHAVT
ncbi:MAG TPA: hypothetical protein VES42_05295 [Pilimelia sp.]|nr:hypothetical protein [Pilimelia sp.]